MAIYNGASRGKPFIDLSGPGGNAFVLLATANRLGRQLKFTREQQQEIHAEMTSGDYEHLIETFEKHFGAHVDLYR